eukprot:TRINITY_DN1809_c0_g1_i1.p1 TRINITY_DN1809_c0_g1~~TRINITY_DN1809_c0_g1_i1.p1  ORF type:complete len:614 (-),score=171.97 TRINITY_DN1809_c0_g1_i1:611-2353(-)
MYARTNPLLCLLVVAAAAAGAAHAELLLEQCQDYSDSVQLCVQVDRSSCDTLNVKLLSNGVPYFERDGVNVGREPVDGNVDVACKRVAQISNCFDCLTLNSVELTESGLSGCVALEERCSGEVLSSFPFGCFSDGPCERPPGLGQYDETLYFGHYTADWRDGAISYFELNNPDASLVDLDPRIHPTRPSSLTVDAVRGHLYWVEMGSSADSPRAMVRCNTDGRNASSAIIPGNDPISTVAVSGQTGVLYWSVDGGRYNGSYVMSLGVDEPYGSPAARIDLPVAVSSVSDMEVDPSGRFLFLSGREYNCECGHIVKYDTKLNKFSTYQFTVGAPLAIGLDFTQNVLFVAASYNTFPVFKMDTNFTRTPQRVVDLPRSVDALAVDRVRQQLLVSYDYHISSFDYTGSHEEVVYRPATSSVIIESLEVVNDNPYCCSVHSSPGCLDASVSSCVCKHRPQCCTEGWNQACVEAVEEYRCGNCRAGPCCRAHGLKGCVDRAVTECVCTQRIECCTERWDEKCVALVEELECGVCNSDCCYDHEVPGCHSADVSECVCRYDPFCCEATWDASCVAIVTRHQCGQCA